MITCLVVEDFDTIRKNFISKLKRKYSEIVTIVGQATTVKEALSLALECRPDLLFLDIELPDGSGFDIIERLDYSPLIVMVTASNAHGIEAVNQNVFYYMTKPIMNSELENVILKIEKKFREEQSKGLNSEEVIILSTSEGYSRVQYDQILYCQSEGSYTTFYLKGGGEIIISKSLKNVFSRLSDSIFVKINQSVIVNKNYVKQWDKEGYIHLANGKTMLVSKRKRSEVKAKLFTK